MWCGTYSFMNFLPCHLPVTHSSPGSLDSLTGLEYTGNTLDLGSLYLLSLSSFPPYPVPRIGMAYSLTYSGELCSNSLFSMLLILQITPFITSICLIQVLLVLFVLALILNLKYCTMYLNITLFIIHNTVLEVKIHENKKLFVFITNVSQVSKIWSNTYLIFQYLLSEWTLLYYYFFSPSSTTTPQKELTWNKNKFKHNKALLILLI